MSKSAVYQTIAVGSGFFVYSLGFTQMNILTPVECFYFGTIFILLAILRNRIKSRTNKKSQVLTDKFPHSGSGRSKETVVNIKKKLEKGKERILLAISKHPKVEAVIAKKLSIGTDIAAFNLEELRRSKFVKVAHIIGSEWEGIPSRTEWSIDHLGLKYLVYHKLIK